MPADATPAVLVETSSADQHLTRLIGAFLAGFSSASTRRAYAYDLRAWCRWCAGWGIEVLGGVQRTHVQLYMRELEGGPLAASTRARRLTTVRSFYGWCIEEGFCEVNPCARVRGPKLERRILPALTRVQTTMLLDHARGIGGYDHATVALLLFNALRISEACGADLGDLGVDRYHRTLTIVGKGSKVDTVPLPPVVSDALARAHDGREVGPLLLTRAGTRAGRSSVTRTLRRLCRAAGVPTMTPHALRRTAIQLMLAGGESIREVQLFARHASISTTEIYDTRRRSMDEHLSYALARHIV